LLHLLQRGAWPRTSAGRAPGFGRRHGHGALRSTVADPLRLARPRAVDSSFDARLRLIRKASLAIWQSRIVLHTDGALRRTNRSRRAHGFRNADLARLDDQRQSPIVGRTSGSRNPVTTV
jgi:hypothetical protein